VIIVLSSAATTTTTIITATTDDTTSMPKQPHQHQPSIDSFFGSSGGGSKRVMKKQKTVTSYFKQQQPRKHGDKENDHRKDDDNNDDDVTTTASAEKPVDATTATTTKHDPISHQDKEDDDRIDSEGNNKQPVSLFSNQSRKRESPTTKSSSSDSHQQQRLNSKRRPAILDDDDDDDDDNDNDDGNNDNANDDSNSSNSKNKDLSRNRPVVKVEEKNTNDESSKPQSSADVDVKMVEVCTSSSTVDSHNQIIADTVKIEQVDGSSKDDDDDVKMTQQHLHQPETEDDDNINNNSNIPAERKKLLQRANKIAKLYKVEQTHTLDSITSPILYSDLVKELDDIEAISSRLDIQAILTKFLRKVLWYSPQDIYAVVYLASNSVAPAYECVELGIGDSLLIKAISEAYGSKPNSIKGTYQEEGDLGIVAQSCKSKQRTLGFGAKPKPLTVQSVLQVFREIANISGSSSQKFKVDKIKKLLVAVQDSTETKYIIRSLQGKLRIGLAQSTVLIALAHALTMTLPATVVTGTSAGDGEANDENENDNVVVDDDEDDHEDEDDSVPVDPIVTALTDESIPVEKTLEAAANMVRKVYSEVPSYDALLDAALKVPLIGLHQACHFQPGIPVEPMLAKPTKSIQEVLKRLNGQEFTCEYKYDGERAQIHMTVDGTLKVFSRNLLETSNKYPEVPLFVQEAARVAIITARNKSTQDDDRDNNNNNKEARGEDDSNDQHQPIQSFVLDAEVVAFNQKTGQLVPFQVLSTRKKTEESAETAKVQVIVQAFDLMYLNGKSLLSVPLRKRRALLHTHFAPVEGKFQFATSIDCADDGDTTTLEQFLDAAVKGQCEGLMVKTMVDMYEPSRRSLNWLKLKKDYLDGLGDSLDLVPRGGYYGKGKRTGVYGAYLLACYDEETEEFQSVCKIGTGFSDEDLQSLSTTLNEHKLEGGKSSQYVVADGLECDVWFDAVQVWEVKAADLSKSSLHRGAIGKLEEGRGIGLRFPRFERIREDKSPEQATNSDQILEMYYNQDTVKGQGNGNGNDNDDGDDDDGI
jgi:DNA ligase-1